MPRSSQLLFSTPGSLLLALGIGRADSNDWYCRLIWPRIEAASRIPIVICKPLPGSQLLNMSPRRRRSICSPLFVMHVLPRNIFDHFCRHSLAIVVNCYPKEATVKLGQTVHGLQRLRLNPRLLLDDRRVGRRARCICHDPDRHGPPLVRLDLLVTRKPVPAALLCIKGHAVGEEANNGATSAGGWRGGR